MNLKDVKDAVKRVKNLAGDPEGAHCTEDDLYRELLASIADGSCEDPAKCAKEALKTRKIDFPRWCA